jgi:hypothetical protein
MVSIQQCSTKGNRLFMKNNAAKSIALPTNSVFPWSEDECAALGISVREAILAWQLLQNELDATALIRSGYVSNADLSTIQAAPSFARAMQIMGMQYLNAVAFPAAIKAQMQIVQKASAPPAARVQAAARLQEHANLAVDRFRESMRRGNGALDVDAIDRLIVDLERKKAEAMSSIVDIEPEKAAKRGQNRGQTQIIDDYLSDLLE